MGMLPDLRFVLGGAVAISLLGMTGLGLFATVRLAHQAKIGPLEASRSLAFADQSEWNPFYDPDSARLFEDMAHKPELAEPAAQAAPPEPAAIVQPLAPASPVKEAARGDGVERNAAPVAAAEPPATVPVPPVVTAPVAAAMNLDQEAAATGAIAAAAGGVPPIASAAPAGNSAHAPLSEPLYAKIEQMVWAPATTVAAAPAVPKVQAKPKGLRRPAHIASAARPRVHSAARYRRPQARVGEYGPYYFGTNPWAQ